MKSFEFATPTTIDQALSLLKNNSAILAGGTDLLNLMKDDITSPSRLVNIKQIKALRDVRSDPESGLQIGALVTIDEFASNPLVKENYESLGTTAEEIAGPQIRNMATIGGNLLQRPRCWYFRGGFGLLGTDTSGKSLVVNGDNRYHAILGNEGPAYFVQPSTLAPALITLGAKIRIAGPKGIREIPLSELYRIPKTNNEREHTLGVNEILTELLVPPATAGWISASYEVRQKVALDWPLATASVALQMEGDHVKAARIVLGHVAPIPWRSPEAEQSLTGKTISPATAQAAADAALKNAKSLSGNKYKIQLARVAVKRAILKTVEGGKA